MFTHCLFPFLSDSVAFCSGIVSLTTLTSPTMGGQAIFIAGVFLGISVLAMVLSHVQRAKLRRMRRYLKADELLNHHIRDALQIIVNIVALPVHGTRDLLQIRSAVNRIDWALREALPTCAEFTEVSEANCRKLRPLRSGGKSSAQLETTSSKT